MTERAKRVWFTLAAIALFALGVVLIQMATLPDVSPLARQFPATTAFIARYEERGRASWQPVPLDQIAPSLALAVLVSEDIGFFFHHGFALADMRQAVQEALQKGEAPRGASTITQQLAKNLWLSPSRNPLRKLKEALLTRELERRLSKDRILELYLNVAEFGPGVYGAEAAARTYFGKFAADLTDEEAALLAASLPRPATWHPGSTGSGYLRQVAKIEVRMERAGFLRRRFGLPIGDTILLLPDSLLRWDSLALPESLLIPDSVPLRDSTTPKPPDTIPGRPAG